MKRQYLIIVSTMTLRLILKIAWVQHSFLLLFYEDDPAASQACLWACPLTKPCSISKQRIQREPSEATKMKIQEQSKPDPKKVRRENFANAVNL
jgi:hypothetical protein